MELNKKIIDNGMHIINALLLIVLGLNTFTHISIPDTIKIIIICLWLIGFILKLTQWKENAKEENIFNLIVLLFLVGGTIWVIFGE